HRSHRGRRPWQSERQGDHHGRLGLHRPARGHRRPGDCHRGTAETLGNEMFDHEMRDSADRVLHACRKRKLRLVTAESCTGGLVAATLTAIAGSSDVVERAFVTYANEAKREMLGVSWDALLGYGAVSEPVARAMAAGALARSTADLAVSVTGIAGPGGGTA